MKIKLLERIAYDFRDYGGSTRGCQWFEKDTVMDVQVDELIRKCLFATYCGYGLCIFSHQYEEV